VGYPGYSKKNSDKYNIQSVVRR